MNKTSVTSFLINKIWSRFQSLYFPFTYLFQLYDDCRQSDYQNNICFLFNVLVAKLFETKLKFIEYHLELIKEAFKMKVNREL